MYCRNCFHIMEKQTSTDEIVFYCSSCKTSYTGRPEDTLIISATRLADNTDAYDGIKKYAALDQCNHKIEKECAVCSSPYMSLVRIGATERAVLVCFCGNEVYYE